MFSVIIPVHNSEKTIEDTVINVLKELPSLNNEIIIVNDGSTDKTIEVLKKFEGNEIIKIIHQSNMGVSSARNTGLNHVSAQSKFVTFVDDSDFLSKDFFLNAKNFFDRHSKIELAISPITIVENNVTRDHILNFRFYNNYEYVDILNDIESIQYHIGGVVFRTHLFINEKFRFDENIQYWEDAKLINSIILEKQFYGLIKNSIYFYSRNESLSLSQAAWSLLERYTPQIKNNYFFLIEKSINLYGENIEYIQYLIANHFLEYLREHNQPKITYIPYLEKLQFKMYTKKLFTHISVKIIDLLKVNSVYKNYLYTLKGEVFPYYKNFNKINLYIQKYDLFSNELLFSFSNDSFGISFNSEISFVSKNGKHKKAIIFKHKTLYILGNPLNDFSRNIFSIKIPLSYLLFGCKVLINDKELNQTIQVDNPSLFKRKFKKIKKQIRLIKK